jgi:hypothetical protein
LQSRKWWLAQFSSRGFDVTAAHKFEPQDMVRGHGQSFKDWHPADGGGMHVVARRLDTQSI